MSSVQITQSYAASSQAGFFANRITVGTKPVMVTHLGRYKTSGNWARHPLMILKLAPGVTDVKANGHDVPSEVIASVIMEPSATVESGFQYKPLQQPVVLEPGQTYFLASLENTYESKGNPAVYELFPSSGTCSTNIGANTLYGADFTLDQANNYHMGLTGTWDATGEVIAFAPLVNIKIN